jgi:SAM-dependent methyltransferase
LDGLHVDRGRAELFGSIAQMYDRFRPTYPDDLIDDLAALHPSQVLDVGCGTGKAAAALVRRGLPVLGVEPDERMAGVARCHGVPVEVASFEAWSPGGRTFDLITSAQAWHWIDPAVGIPKVARLLRAGGTIALFWNYHVLDEPVISAFDAIYRQHASGLEGLGHDPSDGPDVDPFAGNDAFTSVETRTYRWERTLTADEWVGLVATFSDHQRLGSQRLTALRQALHETIRGFGGVVHSHCGTYLRLARRA